MPTAAPLPFAEPKAATKEASRAAVNPEAMVVVSTPRFADQMSHDEASRVAPMRGYDEGQRNEALNHLRESDPLAAAEMLMAMSRDVRESVRFRSWCYQHLGLLWRDLPSGLQETVEKCLIEGFQAPIDSAMWREALLALSESQRPSAHAAVRRVLDSLTPAQRSAMGPLHDELKAKVASGSIEL